MDPNGSVPVLWQEARNAEGRPYYYNVQTKVTQWTKPQELKTPVEVRGELRFNLSLTDPDAGCAGETTMEGIHNW
jgi:pre-mRNA-processing factor 40